MNCPGATAYALFCDTINWWDYFCAVCLNGGKLDQLNEPLIIQTLSSQHIMPCFHCYSVNKLDCLQQKNAILSMLSPQMLFFTATVKSWQICIQPKQFITEMVYLLTGVLVHHASPYLHESPY